MSREPTPPPGDSDKYKDRLFYEDGRLQLKPEPPPPPPSKQGNQVMESEDLRLVAQLYHLCRDNTRVTILGDKSLLLIEECLVTIEVTGDWTEGALLRYGGETIHQAIQKASDDQASYRELYPIDGEGRG